MRDGGGHPGPEPHAILPLVQRLHPRRQTARWQRAHPLVSQPSTLVMYHTRLHVHTHSLTDLLICTTYSQTMVKLLVSIFLENSEELTFLNGFQDGSSYSQV